MHREKPTATFPPKGEHNGNHQVPLKAKISASIHLPFFRPHALFWLFQHISPRPRRIQMPKCKMSGVLCSLNLLIGVFLSPKRADLFVDGFKFMSKLLDGPVFLK